VDDWKSNPPWDRMSNAEYYKEDYFLDREYQCSWDAVKD